LRWGWTAAGCQNQPKAGGFRAALAVLFNQFGERADLQQKEEGHFAAHSLVGESG
jgi:hypothetical protein